MTDKAQRCPHDGGKCHHGCDRSCIRLRTGSMMTTPWTGFPVAGVGPVPGAMPEEIKTRPYRILDLHDFARESALASPDAWKAFLEAMQGRNFGSDALTDAWVWFSVGYHAAP